MELQRRRAEIAKQGLGLIAVSYDSPDTLKKFADSRGITFPLIADRESAIIRAYGILNTAEKPGARGYGIPYPGTFVVDRRGRVVSRFFEDAYQERYSVAAMVPALAGAAAVKSATAHLSLSASISDVVAAPGRRLVITADITPSRGMHLYAPGKHTYQVVRLVLDPHPWLRLHPPGYPPSEVYHFKPLDERVEVYSKPFRLRQDVTILATPEAQKLLSGLQSVTLSGTLEYQACNDRLCFNPARVPVSFTVSMTGLDRRPAGGSDR